MAAVTHVQAAPAPAKKLKVVPPPPPAPAKKTTVVAPPKVAPKELPTPESRKGKGPGAPPVNKPPSRNTGVTTGMNITEYQNSTLLKNPKLKLTDDQLAAEWRKEFPKAKAFDAKLVALVRKLVNKGAHKNEAPAKPLVGYLPDGTGVPDKVRASKA
jgi:hypothetical protein